MAQILLNGNLSKITVNSAAASTLAERHHANAAGDLILTSSDAVLYGPSASENEFLTAILHAYNNHAGLRIRPDDILQCVAMAVCSCVNDHSEELRDVFMAHQGRLSLIVEDYILNWHELLGKMEALIDQNVKTVLDLQSDFSTTATTRTTATLMKMATMSKYFRYGIRLGCGIRAVDLIGNIADWRKLRNKVKAVADLISAKGYMVNWFKHILAVIDRLIATYESVTPISPDLATFWSRIVIFVPYGSGSQKYLSGWSQVLFPGATYDQFPEYLNLLDAASVQPTGFECEAKSLLEKWAS
ncbi:hypothetical protein HK100_006394 [Physocladia obscura]|uniref:Uncharacterized protein n=1 Tax=Physocladia obscura TaxID=109957 RepID=A0AAD5T5F2_9FUNG|nr:hypothetical protein HK100_006394 [Physocladia obscura]